MATSTLWITFDLGVGGDYEGLYSWLDAHDAEECGESVAVLTYRCEGSIPEGIKEDLRKSIHIDKHTSVYMIYRDPATNENKGMFLFGGRKASAWSGYSSAAPEVNADDGWRRYAWTPPCGTVFQLRKWPL